MRGTIAIAAICLATGASLSAQGRATRPQVVPPQGPVRQVIFKHCTSCHGIDDYAYHARDRTGWDALLTAKHEGLPVPLPAESRQVLLDWLAERSGPTTKPFPRAYVALREGQSVSDADLMAFANERMANYKAIREVVFVDAIPKTASGKILRRELKDLALGRSQG